MRKFIPIILILAILLPGVSIPLQDNIANATHGSTGECYDPVTLRPIVPQVHDKTLCIAAGDDWVDTSTGVAVTTKGTADSFLEEGLQGCGVFGEKSSIVGCFVQIVYHVLIGALTFILEMTATFFDYMAMLTLHSAMYAKEFIYTIWKVVRDFSNVFFILVLLYAALEMILGIGHNPRKTVAAVIIMALLVNFSLFFTRVVVDASNILGLVFYHRIDVTNSTHKPISKTGEKGISSALVSRFNINTFFDSKTINTAKKGAPKLSTSMSLSLMAVYAIVILPLAYAFLIVGLSFLGRMINLMLLMMVAPFAFVTYAIPALRKKDTIGFDSWLHKLLESAFMGAVFMFLLYIVSEILKAKIFNDIDPSQGIAATLIGIFIPALIIILILLKGAKYAKKASGEFTEGIMKTAGLLGGVALGGAAILGTGAVGMGTMAAQKTGLSKYLEKKTDDKGFTGWAARTALKTGNYTQKASFDLRNVPGLSKAMSKSGIDLGASEAIGLGVRKDGYKGDVERRAKKLKEESELYKTSMTDAEVQKWSKERKDKWEAEGGEKSGKPKPKEFSSARKLNEHRMEGFRDRLGIEGLLGSVMYSAVSGADWAKTSAAKTQAGQKMGLSTEGLTEEQKKNYAIWGKRIVGTGLGAAVGGFAGGTTIGGAGAVAKGAALGTGYTWGYGATQGAAEKKAGKEIENDMKKEKEIEERLARQKEKLGKQAGEMEKASEEEAKKPEEDRLVRKTGEEDAGQPVFEINSEKLEDALRESTVQQKKSEGSLQALSQKIASQGGKYENDDKPNENKYMGEIRTAMKEIAYYTRIKNTHKEMSNTRMDIYKISSDKHRVEEEKKSGHGTNGKPGTTSSTPKAEPSEEEPGGVHNEPHT